MMQRLIYKFSLKNLSIAAATCSIDMAEITSPHIGRRVFLIQGIRTRL
jgi:hypothetical protein